MIPSIVRARIISQMLDLFGKRIKQVNAAGTKIILGQLTVQVLLPTEDGQYVLDVTDTKTGEFIGEFNSVQKLYATLTR